MAKLLLISLLSGRDPDDYGWGNDLEHQAEQELRQAVIQSLAPEDLAAVVRDCGHPREAVRAGALLLLASHPAPEVRRTHAQAALADPSFLVRAAAASALALHRDPGGEEVLIEGLDHERWELRFWCAKMLCYFPSPRHRAALERRQVLEPDTEIRSDIGDMLREAFAAR